MRQGRGATTEQECQSSSERFYVQSVDTLLHLAVAWKAEWHYSRSDPSQTASSQLKKQSIVNRNKPRLQSHYTLVIFKGQHICGLPIQIIAETGPWSTQTNFLGLIRTVAEISEPQPIEMRYNVTFNHRNKEHHPSNASQPTSHARMEVDGRRRWVYASAMAPLFIHAGQHAALFIHLRDTLHMTLPHLDEPASDKQVNANSSARRCLTTSASFPLFPLLIFSRSHAWHMEMWELFYPLLYTTTLAALAWTLIALWHRQ